VSRFDGILKAKGRGPAPDEAPPGPAPAPPPPAAPPSPAPPRGRPKGKRSDPAYEQVTAYIPGELYRNVRIGLLQDARGQEFSELVADLLSAWLAGRKPG
jgi:hypothetical protein